MKLNMSVFNYIFLDLDGTISNSAFGIKNSIAYALTKLDKPIPSSEVLDAFIGPPLSGGFKEYCGLNDTETEKAIVYYREYYREKGIFECELYSGISETVKKLNDSGKKLFIATSKPEEFAKRVVEHFGLTEYFTYCAGASFDDSRSTKGDVLAYAIKESGLTDKSQAIMIGDRNHDIIGAKGNGIKSIGVLYGFGDRKELENAGADYIAATANDILNILL